MATENSPSGNASLSPPPRDKTSPVPVTVKHNGGRFVPIPVPAEQMSNYICNSTYIYTLNKYISIHLVILSTNSHDKNIKLSFIKDYKQYNHTG